MTHGDGDGWVGCGQEHQHWGRHGAAGLLIWAPDGSGRPLVLLIRRAGWSHHGDTWGPPGGARDSHETPAEAAVPAAARTALQCHGAIGYTVEHDLHLWMKRAWALAAAWGDAAFHRARVGDCLLRGGP